MRKILLTLLLLSTTLFTMTLSARAQSAPPPVATGEVTVADALAAFEKGHLVQPNPEVVLFFEAFGLGDANELPWYKFQGLLYGFFFINDNAIVFVVRPNGEMLELVSISEE